ncbi:MAG TPA: hypothetical protein VMU39_07115 [Solirubrobacteraceae bacterium]|nr:hypothetical protein [Solirubrobacteraceae bacterium]
MQDAIGHRELRETGGRPASLHAYTDHAPRWGEGGRKRVPVD